MANGFFNVPIPVNEPVKSYAPGSKEREELLNTYNELREQQLDIPMYIGGEEVRSGKTATIAPPHDHKRVIANYHQGMPAMCSKPLMPPWPPVSNGPTCPGKAAPPSS